MKLRSILLVVLLGGCRPTIHLMGQVNECPVKLLEQVNEKLEKLK